MNEVLRFMLRGKKSCIVCGMFNTFGPHFPSKRFLYGPSRGHTDIELVE